MSRPPPSAPPPSTSVPTGSLPTEVAIVVLVDSLARSSDRWNDVVREGGYLDRFVQRVGGGGGAAKHLRISLLSFSALPAPSVSPIRQTQYFREPGEFWASVRGHQPSGGGASGAGAGGASGGEQALLEAMVGGIELFDLHTSHPFSLPTPSPSPPYMPAASSGSSATSNTSPQNGAPSATAAASHLSPPNPINSTTTSQSRPAVERYLFVFLGNDPAYSLPSPSSSSSNKSGGSRWSAKRVGGAPGGGKVRWNRTRKLDGVGWDQLAGEMTKRQVRASLVGLGGGTGEGEMGRLKSVLGKTSYTGNDQAWFPTPKGDLFLLYGLDPTKNHLKRTHSQSQVASPAGGTASPGGTNQKRQRVSPPNALSLPLNNLAGAAHPFPSVPGNLGSSANLQAASQGGSSMDQAQRIQAMQRQLASNPAAMAQQLARAGGPSALHPSLQGLSVSPDMQAQYAALSNVAQAADLGSGGSGNNSAQANALAQQYHRQRLQAQFTSAAGGQSGTSSPAVPSQAPSSVPSQQPPRPSGQQQQQPQPGRPVWRGELGWSVGAKPGSGGAMLGCKVLATTATPKIVLEDLQLSLWKERLQLTGVIQLKIDELKVYASRGQGCVRLMPEGMGANGSKEGEERVKAGERSFASLVNSLATKNVAGIIRMGGPGCGMVVFPMSQAQKTTVNPTGSAQLIAMVFLKTPIPFDLNARLPPPIAPAPSQALSQPKPQYPQQPPNLTVKTGQQQLTAAQIQQQQQQRLLAQQRQLQLQQQQQQQQAGGGGGGGGGGLTNEQMAEFMKAYPAAGGNGGRGWP